MAQCQSMKVTMVTAIVFVKYITTVIKYIWIHVRFQQKSCNSNIFRDKPKNKKQNAIKTSVFQVECMEIHINIQVRLKIKKKTWTKFFHYHPEGFEKFLHLFF